MNFDNSSFAFKKKLQAFLTFTFSFSFYFSSQAQSAIPNINSYKTTAEKLNALKHVCDSLSDIEDYGELKTVAAYSLKIVPPNNLANLALFNHYLGISMEGLISRDSAIYYHEKALAYAKQGNISKRIRTSHQRLLYLYHSAGNEQKADNTALELKNILDTVKDKTSKYSILSFLGNYHNERSEYEKNVEYLLKSIDIQKELLKEGGTNDSSDIGISLLNVAKAYIDMKQPEKAIEFIKPTWAYLANYQSGQTYYHKNYLDAWLLLNNPTKALLHYDSLVVIVNKPDAGAFEWSDKLNADLVFTDYYLTKNNTDSALLFVTRADKKASEKASEYVISQINFMKGKVLAARKEYGQAIPLLKGAEELTRNSSLQVHASLLQTLAQSYAATGQWQEAYNYYEKYAPLRDSLYTEASKKSIADAEAKFQNKEKQQQIENKNLQLSAARTQRIWLVAGLALLSLVAILLVVIYRNKKKTADILDEKNKTLAKLNNDLEEANQTKAKLFSIISHDLRSPISQVYQFLKLQQLNPDALNSEQRNELSNKIQTATGSLLETMEDLLLWSKTQMSEFKTNIQSTKLLPIINACQNLLQLNTESKNIRYTNLVEENTIINTDPYYLQTIIRNLLQNAVKASPDNTEIEIGTEQTTKGFVFYIQNEGGSFTQEQYKQIISSEEKAKSLNGLGLRLVDELSQKIGASVIFKSTSDALTRVEILIPKG
jgi:signal transduction histidine kinase